MPHPGEGRANTDRYMHLLAAGNIHVSERNPSPCLRRDRARGISARGSTLYSGYNPYHAFLLFLDTMLATQHARLASRLLSPVDPPLTLVLQGTCCTPCRCLFWVAAAGPHSDVGVSITVRRRRSRFVDPATDDRERTREQARGLWRVSCPRGRWRAGGFWGCVLRLPSPLDL